MGNSPYKNAGLKHILLNYLYVALVFFLLIGVYCLIRSCSPNTTEYAYRIPIGGQSISSSAGVFIINNNQEKHSRFGIYVAEISDHSKDVLWKFAVDLKTGVVTDTENDLEQYTIRLPMYFDYKLVSDRNIDIVRYDGENDIVVIKTTESPNASHDSRFEKLFAISRKTGDILWQYGLDSIGPRDVGFTISTPAASGDNLALARVHYVQVMQENYDTNQEVLVYRIGSGRRWAAGFTFFDTDPTVSIHDNIVYMINNMESEGYNVLMWNLANGEELSADHLGDLDGLDDLDDLDGAGEDVDIGGGLHTLIRNFIYSGDAKYYRYCDRDKNVVLVARNIDTDEIIYQRILLKAKSAYDVGELVQAGSYLFQPCDSRILILDLETGNVLGQINAPATISSFEIKDDSLFILGSMETYVYQVSKAIRPNNAHP